MRQHLDQRRLHRLDIQGFDHADEAHLAQTAPWLRLPFVLCGTLAVLGTALGSPTLLVALSAVAVLAAFSPVHPFDLIYNLGIRHVTRTPPLPHRGIPTRFTCGMGAIWLLATAWAFGANLPAAGYALGFSLASVAALVSATDICIPSIIFRRVFGPPAPRGPTGVAREAVAS